MAQRSNIVDGPSRFDLMLALFFDRSSVPRYTVEFMVEDMLFLQESAGQNPTPVAFVINQLAREGGSGEKWLFEGYYQIGRCTFPVSGFFSTRTRKGWVEEVK